MVTVKEGKMAKILIRGSTLPGRPEEFHLQPQTAPSPIPGATPDDGREPRSQQGFE